MSLSSEGRTRSNHSAMTMTTRMIKAVMAVRGGVHHHHVGGEYVTTATTTTTFEVRVMHLHRVAESVMTRMARATRTTASGRRHVIVMHLPQGEQEPVTTRMTRVGMHRPLEGELVMTRLMGMRHHPAGPAMTRLMGMHRPLEGEPPVTTRALPMRPLREPHVQEVPHRQTVIVLRHDAALPRRVMMMMMEATATAHQRDESDRRESGDK